MSHERARWTSGSTLAVAALVGACAGSPEADVDGRPPEPVAEALLEARASIGAAIGDARAPDESQCALVAIGSRPCGGPSSYLAYSMAQTDSAELAALVDIYTRLEQRRNQEQGLVSTCELMAPPSLVFENGRCSTMVGIR